MPRLLSVATALPATRVDQKLAAAFARQKFAGRIPDLERLLPLFTKAGIQTRYFAAPQEWFFTDHDLAEKSAMYAREATHSLDVMGWTVLREGLQVVFAQRIPEIVEQTAADDLGAFLAEFGLKIADVDAFLLHPGGTKVLEAYEKALALDPAQLALPRAILRDYGNMSSATVLFVLERYLAEGESGTGGYGLISALGPGFCSESLLVAL